MFQNPELAFGGTLPMLGLIDSIYATVQRPELWDDVLLQISSALASHSIALYAGTPDSEHPPLVGVQNIDARAWSASFTDYYASISPIYPACVRKFSPRETWYSNQALPDAEFDKTEFCNDYYKPNGMYYTLGLLLAVKDAPRPRLVARDNSAPGRLQTRRRSSARFCGHTWNEPSRCTTRWVRFRLRGVVSKQHWKLMNMPSLD